MGKFLDARYKLYTTQAQFCIAAFPHSFIVRSPTSRRHIYDSTQEILPLLAIDFVAFQWVIT